MTFEPIAIVGRSCIFPGAFTPDALWKRIVSKADMVGPCPAGRLRVPRHLVLRSPETWAPDYALTDQGGYVEGFERVFDPKGFGVPPEELLALDELFQWLLHAGREALRDARIHAPSATPPRTGAVLGLPSLPTEKMVEFAETVWLAERPAIDARNRFCGGLPAHILANGLRLDKGAFSLDAACASSLYAIKSACEMLQEGTADLMLAGAANRGDPLYLQIAFSALGAVSSSGRSRPFCRDADGLLPAEGAAFVALKRLSDAVRTGDRIYGVIRGIGTGNDGTGEFFSPSEAGQSEAIGEAYKVSGLEPGQISLFECNAAGAPVRDTCEIKSSSRVFEGFRNIPAGSVKSNLGHAMAAAGMSGLLKILGAIEAGVRPAMLHAGAREQHALIAGSPFRLLTANEEWAVSGPRFAALSAFGFGGNNAHLIVGEARGTLQPERPLPSMNKKPLIAVTAIGAQVGSARGSGEVARSLLLGERFDRATAFVDLDIYKLSSQSEELRESLPQQAMMLAAVSEALSQGGVPGSRTGVYIGCGIDPEIARSSLHARLLTAEDRKVCQPLSASAAAGRFASMTANRISGAYGFRGPSIAVLSEELSGLAALRLAGRALASGEVDTAIAGAVDLPCEAVHEAAAEACLPEDSRSGLDAAVCFTLKRLDDAQACGDRILAILNVESGGVERAMGATPATPVPGLSAHAAHGMVGVARAVLQCAHRATAHGQPWISADNRYALRVDIQSFSGASDSITVTRHDAAVPLPLVPAKAPQVFTYAAADRQSLANALREGKSSTQGTVRVAFVATGEEDLHRKRAMALRVVESGVSSPGIWFAPEPLQGDVAFVFPGSAAVYQGAGASLLLAFPETLDSVHRSAPLSTSSVAWLYSGQLEKPTAMETVWACSVLSYCYAHFTRRLLGLHADAALGMSVGETNALFAFDVWQEPDRYLEDVISTGLLDRLIAEKFEVLGDGQWETWLLTANGEERRRLLEAAPGARVLTIHTAEECLLAGSPEAMRRVRTLVDPSRVRRVGLDLIVHTPDAAPVADLWRQLCHRPFCPPPAGTRFYQMAGARACELASDSFANSYTEQFLNTIDFPRLIESAWRDGVRVFVEHGPLGTCSKWIPQILGERSHAAVPLAAVGSDALAQSAAAIAQMFVAGVAIDPERFNGRMRQTRASVRTLRLPAHLPRLTGLRRALPPSDAARPSPAAIPGRSFAVYRTRAASLTGNSNGSLERPGSGVQPSHSHASVGARLAPSVALLERDAAPAPPVKLTRAQLELTTFGKPSEVFGPMFRPLDDYPRIVRLPMAQMLLADRITSIEGERGSMGTGAIVAETDIVSGAWYLNSGRMPPSIVAEAGQVQMLLISWLGIDFLVKGERKYRALGCDMTIHSEMPTIGDTLRCEARITGHAKQGDLRLFFFEYDCYAAGRLFASARNGQAGFFTESELSSSTGIVWNPEGARWSDFRPGTEQPQRELPSSYPLEKVRAAAAGNAYECFGEGFEVAAAQQRAPSFCNEKFLMIDSVAVLDIHGGPKGRGYLRASYNIKPDHWVFGCHFKDDPCLPGTFMFEGAMQCMSFYLMALGCTLRRDGWRFQPVPGSLYPVRFRGQITPRSKVLTYELFVDEIVNGDEPTLYAHVLGLVDGVKTFHFPRLAVRLVPGHPLDLQPPLEAEKTEVASVNGVRLDRQTMMECALGLPSKAFGAPYARFDRYERCPRVPAPPLKFIDRIRRLDGTFGVERAGAVVEAEYDLIPDAWYFEGARKRTMAFAALLEAALQPCGWLGFFTGVALRSKTEVYFRNLDGNAIVHAACPEREGKLRTRAVLTSLSRSGPITLLGFDVRTMLDDVLLLEVQTKFGFFRAEELRGQKGIPASPDEIARFGADSAYHAAIAPDGPVPLPSGKLLMIDRITGLWAGGAHGCGRIRGEKSISPSDWFFRSHFYGDPVQPGSLGIEAILQTARYYAMEGYARDRGFASIASSPSGIIEWKYRGQVLPANRKIETEVSILGIRNDRGGCEMECHASLWSDGIRIYSVPRFALQLQREI